MKSPKEQPPTLYVNGVIVTGNQRIPRGSWMTVEAGRIVDIGEGEPPSSPDQRVDLQGFTVLPGFNDCHMHILSLGLTLKQVNVAPDATPTIAAIRSAVRRRVAEGIEGGWILGRGYNQNLLAERRHPNRQDLDEASGGIPMALWHTSGHVMTVNTRALQLAGIDATTEPPPGGEIERDGSGNPTGVLKETAMALVRNVIPEPPPEFAKKAILEASNLLAREGITSASDAATGLEHEIEAYRAAAASDDLKTRMVLMPRIQEIVDGDRVIAPESLANRSHGDWLRIGPTKIFSDGALTTRTAAVNDPYLDTSERGLLTWEPDALRDLILAADRSGWQIATHAIGDRAIELVLECYGQAQSQNPRADARHRIEHFTIASQRHIETAHKLGVVAILQPEDIAVLGDAYEPALGKERAGDNSPVQWLLNEGVALAFSSDRPVTPGHPLVGIRAALERTTPSGSILGMDQRVDVETAIRAYTAGGAYATFMDQRLGRLAPGFLADFVVLDRDITTCQAHEITSASVVKTVVGGGVVFDRG